MGTKAAKEEALEWLASQDQVLDTACSDQFLSTQWGRSPVPGVGAGGTPGPSSVAQSSCEHKQKHDGRPERTRESPQTADHCRLGVGLRGVKRHLVLSVMNKNEWMYS